jgi:hypothetical protein
MVSYQVWELKYQDSTKAGLNLNQSQIEILNRVSEKLFNGIDSFVESIHKTNEMTPDMRLTILAHYDPVLIGRFCIARDFNEEKVLKMIYKDLKWRYFDIKIDKMMEIYPKSEWYKIISQIYPTITHGVDKFGVEMNWEKVTMLDIDDFFKNIPLQEIVLFHIFQVESSERRVSSKMNETGIYRFRRALI